jgi:hypothetical protein
MLSIDTPHKPRLVLPLSSMAQDPVILRVPPRQPTRISARTTKGAFDVEHLYISGAATPGGAADWVVNDVEVDGRSQLIQKDLPGALFGTGLAAGRRASTALSFSRLDPVERDRELVLVVTYVGPNPAGVPFFASAIGTRPPQRPTVVPVTTSALLPLMKTTISARMQNVPFQLDRLEIDDGVTDGGVADWIVHDLRVDGRTQFVQSGDLPGDMFSSSAIDSFFSIENCPAGSAIEIDVSYIGLNEKGCPFVARLEGTVTRADYTIAPPDLHVLVRTSGQGLGDAVIATCDWRQPAIDDRAP